MRRVSPRFATRRAALSLTICAAEERIRREVFGADQGALCYNLTLLELGLISAIASAACARARISRRDDDADAAGCELGPVRVNNLQCTHGEGIVGNSQAEPLEKK